MGSCARGSASSELQSGHLSGWGCFLGICRSGDLVGYKASEDTVAEGVTQQGCFNKGCKRGEGMLGSCKRGLASASCRAEVCRDGVEL